MLVVALALCLVGYVTTSFSQDSLSSSMQNEPRVTVEAKQRAVPGELYGAIFGGYTFGHGIELQGTGFGSLASIGTIGMKDSGVYGGKLGYFFPGRANWLGVETEVFRTTPHLKETTITPALPLPLPGVRVPGAQLDVTTLAFNAIARAKLMCGSARDNDHLQVQPVAPRCPLQPYAGVGVGVFFAQVSSQFGNLESPVVGLNVLAGVRYYVIQHVALFAEYKYNRATFRVDDIEGSGAGVDGVYSVSHVVGGISLHW